MAGRAPLQWRPSGKQNGYRPAWLEAIPAASHADSRSVQKPLPEHPAAPVRPSERIDAIDMLRGIALFIVLAVNAATEFRVSIFEQFLPNAGAPSLDSFGARSFSRGTARA